MRPCVVLLLVLTQALLGDPPATEPSAAPPPAGSEPARFQIEHAAIGCVLAEQHPAFEARFAPADRVRDARVRFRPAGSRHWYSVGMEERGGAFIGILPKPKKSLSAFDYYIEVSGEGAEPSRTQDYSPRVVAGPGACQDTEIAAAVGSATVTVEVPTGASASPVPPGFSESGVVTPTAASGAAPAAGAGGLGTMAIVGVVAGGAAVAGAVAVAGGGGSDGDSGAGSSAPTAATPTTTAPTTLPPPTTAPSAPEGVTGVWLGTAEEGEGCGSQRSFQMRMELVQVGSSVSGSIFLTWPVASQTETISEGTVVGGHIAFIATDRGSVYTYEGTVDGNRMSGTWALLGHPTCGPWSVTR
jgi:hypothetical protein